VMNFSGVGDAWMTTRSICDWPSENGLPGYPRLEGFPQALQAQIPEGPVHVNPFHPSVHYTFARRPTERMRAYSSQSPSRRWHDDRGE
jgi:hypothetical protein